MGPHLPYGLDNMCEPLPRELCLHLPASILSSITLSEAEWEQGSPDQLHQGLHNFLNHFLEKAKAKLHYDHQYGKACAER